MGFQDAVSSPAPPSIIDDYDAREAAGTLVKAHEIQANPPLHAAAKKHARKKMAAFGKVVDGTPLHGAKKKKHSAGKPAGMSRMK